MSKVQKGYKIYPDFFGLFPKMEISPDEWRLLDRVDDISAQRNMLITRLGGSFISSSEPSFDRLGKLSCRVDFDRNWTHLPGRRGVRRATVRISEIRGGYCWTKFMARRAVHVVSGRNWKSLSVIDRAHLLS